MSDFPKWSKRLSSPHMVGGRYLCDALLGKGAATEVYYAKDSTLAKRRVAIKTLLKNELKSSLESEKKVLDALNHVGVPKFYDQVEEGGRCSLVLEYVDCPILSTTKMAAEKVIELGVRLLDIVRYLHELASPLVHCDIKPGNILANDLGQLYLIDFAAARWLHDKDDRPCQGTLGYAPPEQLSGGHPRLAWDLYAVGALLHQLLSGVNPANWKAGDPPNVKDAPELMKVLRRSLSINPKERYESARELHMALDRTRKLISSQLPCPSCQCQQAVGIYFCHRCGHSLRDAELKKYASGVVQAKVSRIGLDKLANSMKGTTHSPSTLCFLRNECDAAARPLGFDILMSIDHLPFEPLPHQLRVLKTVLRNHQGRSLLADEVGLGKTVEAGLVREELKMRGLVNSTLILVPPSLRTQWKEELFDKFRERFEVYNPQNDENPRLSRVQNLIISLAAAAGRSDSLAVPEALRARHWDLVIVDEAHHAKNRNTNRYRFLNSLDRSYLLLLTATPMQNSAEELFNLSSLVRPGLLGGRARQFKEIYGVDGKKVAKVDSLRSDLEKVMVRTRRSQAYVKFPDRIPYVRTVTPSPSEASLYEEVTTFIRQIGGQMKSNHLRLIHLQQRLTSSPEAIADSLQNLASSYPQARMLSAKAELLRGHTSSKLLEVLKVLDKVKDRVVIFTDHVPTQRMLETHLQHHKYRTYVFRGSASEKDRALKAFGASGQVLVVSAAGNEGLNLQHYCNVCINFDLPWNPMRVEQRIGRLQRIGQPRDVLVFNLVTANTVEEQVLRILQDKIRLFELSIGQLDLILGEDMTDEDDFQETVWKCLLQARTKEEMEKLLDKKFSRLSERSQELSDTDSDDDDAFLDSF